MKIQLLITSLAVALIANVAAAQEMPADIDANSDGTVTVQEFTTYAKAHLPDNMPVEKFAKMVDADSDGKITQTEFDGRRTILQNMMSESQPAAQEGEEATEALKAGDKAADFELEGLNTTVKLSDSLAKGKTVVVVFSRANW